MSPYESSLEAAFAKVLNARSKPEPVPYDPAVPYYLQPDWCIPWEDVADAAVRDILADDYDL